MKLDTYDRIELTGPWAGFGFQGHKLWTPEGYDLEPCDMRWWSLTCNIAKEWRSMMEQERVIRGGQLGGADESNVILLSQTLRQRRRG